MSETYRFFNREISWIDFNRRVLSEAAMENVPTLERVKFLAIVSSNFDEFFMVRVASLRRAIKAGDREMSANQDTPSQTLKKVSDIYRKTVSEQYGLWNHLQTQLQDHGIRCLEPDDFTQDQLLFVKDFYQKELFNVLSPVKVEAKRPFPFTGNLRLNIAVLIAPLNAEHIEGFDDKKMVVVEVPPYLSRIVWLPDEKGGASFTLVENIIALFIGQLLPGFKVLEQVTFRITRDADIPVDEEKEDDFVEAMAKILKNRMHSNPVRLEISQGSPELQRRLVEALDIDPHSVFEIPGSLNLKDLMSLSGISGFELLKYPVWENYRSVPDRENIWDYIRQEDRLLFHPYESFSPVVRLLSEAAVDPNVLSIRMTLYRTSGDSPIVQALAKAATEGKQVTVLVELKARFDEEQNMGWAQTLENAGGIVIYGVEGLKVHAKALLIIRRENDGICRYAHLGTGNYHDKTARLYTDIGLLTARPEFTHEVAQFFNAITGYSAISKMKYLIMAPHYLKGRVLSLIDGLTRQAKLGISCSILGKMNALADEDVIRALYRASEAGVEIKLNIRGICQLVPGAEFSRNIEVVSIVDRLLEHSRIFVFRAGESEEVYLSSADWMYRNLERRVELMFPIIQKDLKERVVTILRTMFEDNTKAHVLSAEGEYIRKAPDKGSEGEPLNPVRAQDLFHQQAMAKLELDRKTVKHDLVARRKAKTE